MLLTIQKSDVVLAVAGHQMYTKAKIINSCEPWKTEATFGEIYLFADGGSRPPKRSRMTDAEHPGILGVGIYYFTYSTWEGPVLYIEDLFVIPSARGKQTYILHRKPFLK